MTVAFCGWRFDHTLADQGNGGAGKRYSSGWPLLISGRIPGFLF
jgi:hypothetical protein